MLCLLFARSLARTEINLPSISCLASACSNVANIVTKISTAEKSNTPFEWTVVVLWYYAQVVLCRRLYSFRI